MADTGGTRYGSRCAGRERSGAITARAVCAEVLSVVYHRSMGDWGIGYRLLGVEVVAAA